MKNCETVVSAESFRGKQVESFAAACQIQRFAAYILPEPKELPADAGAYG